MINNPTPQTSISPSIAPDAKVEETPQPSLPPDSVFSDYSKFKLKIDQLISDFNAITSKVSLNRENRFKELDIEMLRKRQILAQNEYMIPMRVIDTNIRREQPAFFNYLKGGRRLMIFSDILNPSYVTTQIEDEFTRGMTYSGWEIPHFKTVDGSQTHGWDSVEVEFNDAKPLHVAIEHVGTDNLLFPLDAIDLQSCELIARKMKLSGKQLQTFVEKFGFSEDVVKKILASGEETKKDKIHYVYKCQGKINGIVFVCWYHPEGEGYLSAPIQLSLGIADPETGIDAPIAFYPIFILPYYESEKQRIIDHLGRVFLDLHKQEALTANISQFLNGCQKASTIEVAVKGEITRQAELQSWELGSNKIAPVPLEFFSPPYPDSVMLQLQNYMDSANSQEAGQVNFAANNRKDSRKTATEIAAARDENAVLSSIQVSLYSSFIRQVYSVAWKIVQSQAMQQKITFLAVPETGQNNVALIQRQYDLRSAGDIDVIKRAELIAQYKEFWPIMQTTPAAIPFLARLLRLSFPDEGNTYALIIEQGDPRALLMQVAKVLEDPAITAAILSSSAGLPPEQKQILINLLEQVKMVGEQYLNEQMLKDPTLEDKLNESNGNLDGSGDAAESTETAQTS